MLQWESSVRKSRLSSSTLSHIRRRDHSSSSSMIKATTASVPVSSMTPYDPTISCDHDVLDDILTLLSQQTQLLEHICVCVSKSLEPSSSSSCSSIPVIEKRTAIADCTYEQPFIPEEAAQAAAVSAAATSCFTKDAQGKLHNEKISTTSNNTRSLNTHKYRTKRHELLQRLKNVIQSMTTPGLIESSVHCAN
jgi:hypothetical protein